MEEGLCLFIDILHTHTKRKSYPALSLWAYGKEIEK
jgi:hypothetical protein